MTSEKATKQTCTLCEIYWKKAVKLLLEAINTWVSSQLGQGQLLGLQPSAHLHPWIRDTASCHHPSTGIVSCMVLWFPSNFTLAFQSARWHPTNSISQWQFTHEPSEIESISNKQAGIWPADLMLVFHRCESPAVPYLCQQLRHPIARL